MMHNSVMKRKSVTPLRRITVRFPEAVAQQLEQLALQQDRSLNSEIVRAVREHLARAQGLLPTQEQG